MSLVYEPPRIWIARGNLKKKWYYVIKVFINGRWENKQFVCPTRYATKKERMKWLEYEAAKAKDLLKYGRHPLQLELASSKDGTIKDSLTNAFNFMKLRWSVDYTRQNEIILHKFFDWLDDNDLSQFSANDIHGHHLQEFFDSLVYAGRKAKTHNHYFFLIQKLFKHLRQRGKVLGNPFEFLNCEKIRISEEQKYITKHDRQIILTYLKKRNYYLYFFCQCLYYLCCRNGDLFGLQIKNIDFENWTVYFDSANNKTGIARTNRIPVAARPIFEYLKEYPRHYYVFSYALAPGAERGSRKKVTDKWRYYTKGIEGIEQGLRLYWFKHTGMTDLHRNGVELFDIAKQAGIKYETMLKYYYKHLSISEDSKLVNNAPELI